MVLRSHSPNHYLRIPMGMGGNIVAALRLVLRFSMDNYPGRRLHREAERLLEELLPGMQAKYAKGTPEARLLLKAKWYTISGLWMCRMFNELTSAPLTHAQKLRCACISGMMAVNDYLVDDATDAQQALADLHRMQQDLSWQREGDFFTALNAEFYRHLLENTPQHLQTTLLPYLRQGWEAQIDTRRQFDPELEKQDVLKLISDKCGYMTLMYRAAVDVPLAEGEEQAVYHTGALIQMINDINDLWKDLHAGMRTSATVCDTAAAMAAQVQAQKEVAFSYIRRLPYPARRRRHFMFVFHGFAAGAEANLKQYAQACGGSFSRERYAALPKKQAWPRPMRPASLAYALKQAALYGEKAR